MGRVWIRPESLGGVDYHGEVQRDPELRALTPEGILADQVAYYRARAGEYEDWWFRRGRFDRGPEQNAAWFADVAEVEAAFRAFLDGNAIASALELACGTGLWTRHLAPCVAKLEALDASEEVLAINAARLAEAGAINVDYRTADLFAWRPARRYDLVFMGFWLSHVPHDRFDAFWHRVRDALAPVGCAYVVDSAYEPTSTAVDHTRPDRDSGIVTRRLNDGREYRIVKVFWEAETLAARLAGLGLRAEIARTRRYFIHGYVSA